MKRVKFLLVFGAVLVLIAVVHLRLNEKTVEGPAIEADHRSAEETDLFISDEDFEILFASGSTPEVKATLNLENERQSVVETRSMYQAHAPLRKTGVADADSSQNQEIKKKLLANVLALAEEHQSALSSIPAE